MKRYYRIILTCIALSTIVLAQKLQAYNSNSIQAIYDFAINDPNYGYPDITVTTGQSRSRIPSQMAGKSNLSATLQNHNFVPIPDFKTGVVSEFLDYLSAVKCTPKEALDWHEAYMSDSYIPHSRDLYVIP